MHSLSVRFHQSKRTGGLNRTIERGVRAIDAEALPREVFSAREQTVAAASLTPRLFALADDAAALSDRIARRYFALLPVARTLGGPEPEDEPLKGAA